MERSSPQRVGCLWWGATLVAYAALWLLFAIGWTMVAGEIAGMPTAPVLLPLVAFFALPLTMRAIQPDVVLSPMHYLGSALLATGVLLFLFGIVAKLPLSGYYLDHPAAMLWSWVGVFTAGPIVGLSVSSFVKRKRASESISDPKDTWRDEQYAVAPKTTETEN